MSGSNKLYLGSVAQVAGSTMTIVAGKQLNVIDAPSGDTGVANKKYIDDAVKVVQDSVNLITKDSLVSFDTLLEVKTFADGIASTGATSLTTAITTEREARIAAVSAEAATRLADDDTERAARIAAVSAEETARIAAVSAEETARIAAVSAEETARIAGDAKLDMLAIKSSKKILYTSAYASTLDSVITPLELCSYVPTTNEANFDGWRMRNNVALSKFTLYITPYAGLKVGDVKAMYLELCAVSITSMPFITIYTKTQGNSNDYIDPAYGGSWYRSKKTYMRNDDDTLVAKTNYNMVANLKAVDTFNPAYFTRHNTKLDTIGNGSKNLENMSDDDEILYFTIGSDSGSSVGNVECIISKFKIQLATGIYEFVFSNADVFTEYMKQKQIQLWKSLFASSSTDDPFMNNYQIPARTTY